MLDWQIPVCAACTGCCFDYGNSETDDHDDGCGTMEAIYFGNAHWHGNSGEGDGPWAGADLEQGMYYGGGKMTQKNPHSHPLTSDFVSLALKGRVDGFDLKGGDATQGKLVTQYSGPRPDRTIAGTCGGDSGGKMITLEKCVAGSANQTWGFKKGKLGLPTHIASGARCIDINNYGTKQGNQIWAWPCGSGEKKRHFFRPRKMRLSLRCGCLSTTAHRRRPPERELGPQGSRRRDCHLMAPPVLLVGISIGIHRGCQ